MEFSFDQATGVETILITRDSGTLLKINEMSISFNGAPNQPADRCRDGWFQFIRNSQFWCLKKLDTVKKKFNEAEGKLFSNFESKNQCISASCRSLTSDFDRHLALPKDFVENTLFTSFVQGWVYLTCYNLERLNLRFSSIMLIQFVLVLRHTGYKAYFG